MEQGLSPNQPYQGAARHLGCPLLQYPFLPLCSQERQRNWGETGRQETQGNPTPGWVTAPRFLDLSYPICKMNQLQRQNTSRGPAWSDDSRGLQAGDSPLQRWARCCPLCTLGLYPQGLFSRAGAHPGVALPSCLAASGPAAGRGGEERRQIQAGPVSTAGRALPPKPGQSQLPLPIILAKPRSSSGSSSSALPWGHLLRGHGLRSEPPELWKE